MAGKTRSTVVEYDAGFDNVLSGGRPIPADVVRTICLMMPGDALHINRDVAGEFEVTGDVREQPPKKGEEVLHRKPKCVWPPEHATAEFPDALKGEDGEIPQEAKDNAERGKKKGKKKKDAEAKT